MTSPCLTHLISRVTDAVLEELQESQSRTLDRVWPAGLPKHFRAGPPSAR